MSEQRTVGTGSTDRAAHATSAGWKAVVSGALMRLPVPIIFGMLAQYLVVGLRSNSLSGGAGGLDIQGDLQLLLVGAVCAACFLLACSPTRVGLAAFCLPLCFFFPPSYYAFRLLSLPDWGSVAIACLVWVLVSQRRSRSTSSRPMPAAGWLSLLDGWLGKGEAALTRFSRRKGRAALFVAAFAFLVNASLSLCIHMPQPSVGDDFSYLLAADTFAHGHLVNPSHPFWIHFETFNEIFHPFYASRYPPGQGLLLALGQVVTGRPIVGVWLGIALACAALYWMFLTWMPPRWALFAGLLAPLHPTLVDWGQCYLGGGVALMGGALLMGAWRRLIAHGRARDAWVMGLGMAVLANTRPFEGALLSLAALVGLAVFIARGRLFSIGAVVRRVALPLLLSQILAFSWIGYYNFRVTGDPLLMPYKVYTLQYDRAPIFPWQRERPEPAYHHTDLRLVCGDMEESIMGQQNSLRKWLRYTRYKTRIHVSGAFKLFELYDEWFPSARMVPVPDGDYRYLLILPLILLPWAMRRDPTLQFALIACVLYWPALMIDLQPHFHYAAPIAPLLYLLVIESTRHLYAWRPGGKRVGRLLVRLLPVYFLLSFITITIQLAQPGYYAYAEHRAALAEQLQKLPGQHLVVVRYSPDHSATQSWIYNAADIDGSKVVWAREMGPAQDRALLAYFRNRHVWLLQADEPRPRLVPYPSNGGAHK